MDVEDDNGVIKLNIEFILRFELKCSTVHTQSAFSAEHRRTFDKKKRWRMQMMVTKI